MAWHDYYAAKPIASASDVVIAIDPWRSCVECGTWFKCGGICACPRAELRSHGCYVCTKVTATINLVCVPCRERHFDQGVA